MESRWLGNLHVRFGERGAETTCREAGRRCAPTLLTGLPKPPLATSIAAVRRRSRRLHPNGTVAPAQDGESRTCCLARNAAELQGKKFGEAVAGSGEIDVRP